MNSEVVLVDFYDKEIGSEEKLAAHASPKLHRAFSIFLFDGDRVLMQRRALNKYHSAGMWSNSCCSHPRPGKQLIDEANERLDFEMGISGVELEEIGSFVYYNSFENGLFEYEFDHVFVGDYQGPILANKDEVEEFTWLSTGDLSRKLMERPEIFSIWLPTAWRIALEYLHQRKAK